MSDELEYVALAPGVTRDDFVRAVTELGWIHERTGEGRLRNYEQVWATPEGCAYVKYGHSEYGTVRARYVEDPRLGSSYLCLRGDGVVSAVRALQKRLDGVFLEDEAVEEVFEAQGDEERLTALAMLAVTSSRGNVVLSSALEVALRSPRAEVRGAAVGLMGLRCYPEHLGLLEAAAERDPSEAVRRRALAVLPHVRNRARGEEEAWGAQAPPHHSGEDFSF